MSVSIDHHAIQASDVELVATIRQWLCSIVVARQPFATGPNRVSCLMLQLKYGSGVHNAVALRHFIEFVTDYNLLIRICFRNFAV